MAGYDKAKAWMCPSREHQLGIVVRNGRGITQLLLYRQAVDLLHGDPPEEVDVIGVLVGEMIDVRCSICGRMRTWVPSQAAMERLIEQVLKNR